ncbi:heterokaryon incompatibility protein [Colletotrichum graminicola]|uniref:Heterokaryon incompatibility protein n=1 Tax=Colletotrichum graminicola (strain M1.001 / M2 / FGSC 10212) TaxID=645133 RepID=E3QYS9_COLGM|nr:heterokaryon incompatibility protein [Colletotrichum graminicola M1.001]EFQ36017.1 heterokaryon incompatibility protein [Colletotrichum graminicola M1.001]WDK17136.1 heterokaryon incompatibility protein [Colletotrichum graminicola]
MASLTPYISAKLCQTCNTALYSQSRSSTIIESDIDTSHHSDLPSLRKAAEKGCSICSIVADNLKLDRSRYDTTPGSSEVDGDMDSNCSILCRLYKEITHDLDVSVTKFDVEIWSAKFTSKTRFRMLPNSDGPLRPLLPQAGKSDSTVSAFALGQARDWLVHCRLCHPRCLSIRSEKSGMAWLPTRLLDVGVEGDPRIKLVLTQQDQVDLSAAYITLSYRWGSQPQGLLLQGSNVDSFRRGLLVHDLPRTFQDLVIVARFLSVRYVWIDALCIIQDSLSDWEREGATMRDVYANSTCTIAAAASEDPHGGLFRSRDPTKIVPALIGTPNMGSSPESASSFLYDRAYLDRRIVSGPLQKRGWVFQERMLSPRVLHFADDQIVWECLTDTKCEAFPSGLPFHHSTKGLGPLWSALESRTMPTTDTVLDNARLTTNGLSNHQLASTDTACYSTDMAILSEWRDLVKQYSRCALTKNTDKLPAFAGVAKLFQDITGDAYYAGLWESSFLDQLDWRVYKPSKRVSSEYRAPSWSWASIDGAVRPFSLAPGSSFLPELNDVHVSVNGPGCFGRISEASLQLQGYLVPAIIYSSIKGQNACLLLGGTRQVFAQFLPDTLEVEFATGTIMWCLPLKLYSVAPDADLIRDLVLVNIVLVPVLASLPVRYRRVGLLVVAPAGQDFDDICSFGIAMTENLDFEITEPYSLITIL